MPTTKEKNTIKLSKEEIEKNFSKIKPLLTDNEAHIEASRCLFCYDAPCIAACPTSIDIPLFIRQIMSGNIKGSAKTILSKNILGKSCGDVCPTKVLCEGSCVYLNLNQKPIEIGRLQAYATEYAIKNNIQFFTKGKTTGKKVAVIGGGPAGLSCAHKLTEFGHEVTVFEANKTAGGLNMYGVAPYKFSNEDAKKEVDYVSKIGFKIKTNHKIKQEDIPKLEKEFDAIFIGIGLGKTKKLGITGENLKNIYGAVEFISNLREKEQNIEIGQKVIVIGAGNTAIDAAVESAKLGADVTMIYRRSEKEQSAYYFEVEFAKKNGVKFMYLTSPIEFIGKETIEAIKCIKNTLRDKDSKNSKKPEIEQIKDSEFVISCDMAIIATGQEKQTEFLNSIKNLKLENGKISVNESFQTSNPKYFAGGDAINGGKEVVNAVADGRDAAIAIDLSLRAP